MQKQVLDFWKRGPGNSSSERQAGGVQGHRFRGHDCQGQACPRSRSLVDQILVTGFGAMLARARLARVYG
eukprot:11201907-Lingulodinium_polyedra.AAC.1